MDSGLCEIRVSAAIPTLKDDRIMGPTMDEPHVPAVLQEDEKGTHEPNFHR